jgi:hypothetical protein
MSKRYLVASLAGLIVGCFAMATLAIFPLESLEERRWLIPFWDSNPITGLKEASDLGRQLIHQALLLRICLFALDKGACFMMLPPAFACGLLKLFDLRRTAIFRYSFIALTTLLCIILGIFIFGSCTVNMQEANVGREEYIFLAWWMGFFFVFGFIKLNGIPITLIAATFFTFLGHLIYRWEAEQNSR